MARAPNATNGDAVWFCKCDCGVELTARAANLASGHTQSCGCLQRERAGNSGRTHGYSSTRTYHCWHGMRQRCDNPRSPAYKWYGARGIKVDPRWQHFKIFLADMGECPPSMSIDRVDNEGDYTPRNCRWASTTVQSRNTRANRFLTLNGRTKCISDWAAELNTNPVKLVKRLHRGWSVERTLTTP